MAFLGLFDDNKRYIKELNKIANKVLALDDFYAKKTDAELKAETNILRDRLKSGESKDVVLPNAYALVREAAFRVLGMKHFKTQILGGIALHQGRIAEMRTGEGKTLVSTLPAFLNALDGTGVHIVTVNEYLAERDATWMGKVHRFLGLTVSFNLAGMNDKQKRDAYKADITYSTNSEIGFDYLRDNICISKNQRCQRGLNFAIVDEVDSILIDEARTPLIISGAGSKPADNYVAAQSFVKGLVEEDYDHDIEKKQVFLTDSGVEKAEKFYKVENLGDIENLETNHYINNALKANIIMHRDRDYINNDGQILIVDENTGRVMEGRRYSDGLHQAIEAKEGVEIQNENQTIATITLQNLFRMYKKISGMTGTAKTEEGEFNRIYNLDVVQIPTNNPPKRIDEKDIVYATEEGKFRAVALDAKSAHEKGQPVLIGTVNIDKSELLSKFFKEEKIPHTVLNAKNHEQEAEIIAQAGKLNAVTISTNMAGRGTDILLGGNAEFMAKAEMKKQGIDEILIEQATAYKDGRTALEEDAKKIYDELYAKFKAQCDAEKQKVKEAGGLRIIGTERHESRRIDNQLRGRAGRQGDVGESIFYISLNDDLLLRFGGERMKRLMAIVIKDDAPINFSILGRMIAGAQKRIEGANFSMRRYTLEYDDVMNKQRTKMYEQRNKILDGEPVHKEILGMIENLVAKTINETITDEENWNEWDLNKLNKRLEEFIFKQGTNFITQENIKKKDVNDVIDMVTKAAIARYEKQVSIVTNDKIDFGIIERQILLSIVDRKWIDHIDAMTILKNDIGLRSYAQQDPLVAYKNEGSQMYDSMIDSIHDYVAKLLLNIEINKQQPQARPAPAGVKPGSPILRQSPAQAQKSLEQIKKEELAKSKDEQNTAALGEAELAETNLSKLQAAHSPFMMPSGKPKKLTPAEEAAQILKQQKQQGGSSVATAQKQNFAGVGSGGKVIANETAKPRTYKKTEKEQGRNEPCKCGSGKKYKDCCGKN